MSDISKTIETKRVKPDGSTYAVAAGTTDLTSDAIDTAGYEGVRIIIGFGAITSGAVTSVSVQECSSSGGTYAALEGSKQTVADTDDDKVLVWDIQRPRLRYLNTLIDRGTQNAVVDFMVVELYHPKVMPVTQGATVIGQETWISPPEGTA